MRARLRKQWLCTHRWIGLTAGLLFVLLGVTGSLLVFDHAIDEWLNPGLLLTQGSGKPCSVTHVMQAAEAAFADGSVKAHSVASPRVKNGVWSVWFMSGPENAPLFTAVHVDPYSAQVTGQRVWGEDLMSWIYRLHFRLLAGQTGTLIVGMTGIVLMVSIASGLWLWWPLWRHGWRSAFALRGGRRFQFDLHKLVGLGSSGLLLVVAFTGVYMEFPEQMNTVLELFSPATPLPEHRSGKASSGIPPVGSDEAIAIARDHFPNARFCHFHPPVGPDGAYEVALRQPHETQRSFGRTVLYVDQYTGDIAGVLVPSSATATDAFIAWQFPLHNGEAFGLVGRWLVFATGFAPGILYVTGFTLWWRERCSRRRQIQLSTSRC